MNTHHDVANLYVSDRCRQRRYSAKTVQVWRDHLRFFAKHVGDHPVHAEAVDRWATALHNLAPANAHQHALTVRDFLAWGFERGYWPEPYPVPSIPIPRPIPRALDDADVAALYAVLPDLRALVMVGLLVECGLRIGEASRTNCADLVRSNRILTVHVTGKGGHRRIVPIPPQVHTNLVAYLAGRRLGPLLAGKQGRLRSETISTYVTTWLREAGVKDAAYDRVSAHALRHTAASRVYDRSGGNLVLVMQLMGHANLATTSRYMRHANLEDLWKAMAA